MHQSVTTRRVNLESRLLLEGTGAEGPSRTDAAGRIESLEADRSTRPYTHRSLSSSPAREGNETEEEAAMHIPMPAAMIDVVVMEGGWVCDGVEEGRRWAEHDALLKLQS